MRRTVTKILAKRRSTSYERVGRLAGSQLGIRKSFFQCVFREGCYLLHSGQKNTIEICSEKQSRPTKDKIIKERLYIDACRVCDRQQVDTDYQS